MNYQDIHGGRILLLQGPIGPYFKRLTAVLQSLGAEAVYKVNFNAGDDAFYPGAMRYRGPMDDRLRWLEDLIQRQRIDTVMLFGDCRPVHEGVPGLALRLGIQVRVFEEGYFRPAFVTCETGGTNGYSTIPSTPDFYRSLPPQPTAESRAPSPWTYWAMALWAAIYYTRAAWGRRMYPHYRHHRRLSLMAEAGAWIRGAARKWTNKVRERGVMPALTGELSGRFYIVPLQVHNDAQVTMHSPFADVKDFLNEVMGSFALHGPKSAHLVIKHHPMDRAYRDYRDMIGRLARLYGISSRVHYIHDQHLPTLLEHARGAVVINSTVGLSAIHQGVPTKVLGRAFYDFAGLTFAGSLSQFWFEAAQQQPDRALYQQFRRWVIANTQLNDNFYCPMGNGTIEDAYKPASANAAPVKLKKEALEHHR